jgi:hypothetical protein
MQVDLTSIADDTPTNSNAMLAGLLPKPRHTLFPIAIRKWVCRWFRNNPANVALPLWGLADICYSAAITPSPDTHTVVGRMYTHLCSRCRPVP